MNFLLVGHGGCYNRGCEAIVRTTLLLLQSEFRSSKIAIASYDHNNDRIMKLGDNVEVIPALSKDLWRRFSKDWFTRKFFSLFGKDIIWELEHLPILKYLKYADVVLSIGGDNYTNDYNGLSSFLKLNATVKKFKKKLIIRGASIGPFDENSDMEDVINNLELADLITVRESRSFNYLRSLGMANNIRLVADPAFLLDPEKDFLPNRSFFETDSPILGFNISPILLRFSNGYTNEYLLKECYKFLYKVINEMKFIVFLIPHVTQDIGINNDYNFMEPLYNELAHTKMVRMIPSLYNAMQMKGIISRCELFIGARTHSTIAALSSGIPTLSIGYSVKTKSINEDIFGSDDFVLEAKNLSADYIFEKFSELYTKRKEIKNLLLERIPKFKALAHKNIEYLKEVLE